MKPNSRLWKHLTAIVVLLIILNPETLHLALFIDAVGLDLFLLLLEVQVFTLLLGLLNTKIKPALLYIKYRFLSRMKALPRHKPATNPAGLMVAIPGPAVLMHLLVFSAALGMTLTAYP